MLTLQRASAGSGKTFTLAKKFIWFLITAGTDNGPRLRTRKEVADGLPRILAITFTNKATAEMKARIIGKLAALSQASDTMPDDVADKTDYLSEFCKNLGCSRSKLAETAAFALDALLNGFSDFKVSTIDSFFQTVLRTFAYEANLNEAYQVEVESDYLIGGAVEATLDTINNSPHETLASFWLSLLMKDSRKKGNRWNAFQDKGDNSIQKELKNALRNLDNENFKEIRKELDNYFDNGGAFELVDAYRKIESDFKDEIKDAVFTLQESAAKLVKAFADQGLTPEAGSGSMKLHIPKFLAINPDDQNTFPTYKSLSSNLTEPKKVFNTKFKGGDPKPIFPFAVETYEAYDRFLETIESRKHKTWAAYRKLIPYLGLLGIARSKISDLLGNNNAIQLAETNSILKDIIGEDDTPFIYERLGSQLNHYLIDEFQDTSRLQWGNLEHLLHESHGRGMENLIIGDAKQSIYRFRNADPSLITKTVPETFDRIDHRGMSLEDNTNWRSERTIVEFNNLFFSAIIPKVQALTSNTVDFDDLYANVAQYPHHRDRRGYVEITWFPKTEISKSKNHLSENQEDNPALAQRVPGLVDSLIGRGHRQRDIAILVKSNDQGNQIINAFIEFNTSRKDDESKINFISEESLHISSSDAVGIILSVLRKMNSGSLKPTTNNQQPATYPQVFWSDIQTDLTFFSLRNPQMTPVQQITTFLEGNSPDDAILNLLADMQTVAIPALVESITESFVPEDMRKSQAVFIAAFQDAVLDYCESHSADLGSFLEWWDTKGSSLSISSPEGTDAVQVMTIHKSKGLEFECVILPFADHALEPSPKHSEWRWVKPSSLLDGYNLPPYLPVPTIAKLLNGTEHESLRTDYVDVTVMDNLNKEYVAFTRAKSELYIFAEESAENSKKLGRMLREIVEHPNEAISFLPDSVQNLLPPPEIFSREGNIFRIGTQPGVESSTGSLLPDPETTINDYNVNSSPGFLHYKKEDDEAGSSSRPDAEDTDPRSEGNLLHMVMEHVKTVADLDKALLRLKTTGMATHAQIEKWRPMLQNALSKDIPARWFSHEWDVAPERSLIFPNKTIRPDRIMFSKDRTRAVVVDYKFGSDANERKYIRQVREYVNALREASGIKNVSGFIWYVPLSKITEV